MRLILVGRIGGRFGKRKNSDLVAMRVRIRSSLLVPEGRAERSFVGRSRTRTRRDGH